MPHLLRTVSPRVTGEAQAVVDHARRIARHVGLAAAVDEHGHPVEHTLVDGVDSAVGHGRVGMAKDAQLGQPGEDVHSLGQVAELRRRGPAAEAQEQVPVGVLGHGPHQA